MISIRCGSVDINLMQYTLGADFGVSGISLRAGQGDSTFLDNRFVSIRNGTIDLARGEHTGTAVKFVDRWSNPGLETGGRQTGCESHRNHCLPMEVDYVRNEYRFEKLTIRSNQLALAAEGSHTVIRDCVIESSGVAAIFIAGPNVTIENCEIRLRKLVEGDDAYHQPTRAAIVLHDGSNAVIRNNRIRVDYGGMPSDTHCILVHDAATNVVVEGNTFINVQGEPITLSDGAEALITGNTSENRWWPR